MYMSTIILSCRETRIEAALKLWDATARDDHRLDGRKERLDDLMYEKKSLLMLLTGGDLLDLCFSLFSMTPIPRILFGTNHKGIGFEVEPNSLLSPTFRDGQWQCYRR